MNRAHSYAQVPVQDSTNSNDIISSTSNTGSSAAGGITSKSKGKQNSNGYSTLHTNDDEDEEIAEDSAMLRRMTTASSSAPRRSIYPSRRQPHQLNDDDDDDDDEFDDRGIYDLQGDNEISVAPPLEGASSSSATGSTSSSNASGIQGSSSLFAAGSRGMSGARTTNRSFLARLTGRQRPDRDARIMIQTTMDGVFSNLSAKPRVEKPIEEELPPSYKSAALDISPAYYETTANPAAGYYMDEDESLVDGLPVGGLLGFMWNMIISMSFQFVGFFLTYLLHTSHATKNGSKAGLGFTFMSMGYQMLQGKSFTENGTSQDEDLNDSTGYMGNIPSSSEMELPLTSTNEYYWLSWFMVILGAGIVAQSLFEFARAKRTQMVVNASSSEALEESVSASAAAGTAQAFALAMFTAHIANPQPASSAASGSGSTSAPASSAATAGSGAPGGSQTVVVNIV
ncbi:hypothetical protein BGX24_010411 [Mortierella sp. AD032]|nr:hypothetical protein BGX24_010411 [Mortierella sp. AD032]